MRTNSRCALCEEEPAMQALFWTWFSCCEFQSNICDRNASFWTPFCPQKNADFSVFDGTIIQISWRATLSPNDKYSKHLGTWKSHIKRFSWILKPPNNVRTLRTQSHATDQGAWLWARNVCGQNGDQRSDLKSSILVWNKPRENHVNFFA